MLKVDFPHTLYAIARAYQAGTWTPSSLTEAYLERIAHHNHHIYNQVLTERALASAKKLSLELAQGQSRGLLHGVPIAVKDILDTAGDVTTAGSKLLARTRQAAREDARAIQQLEQAGAIILGKTTMTELAYSGLGINPHEGIGTPDNALAQGHIPGGSSSGSAVAVAKGLACLAIGSDTGGSVRIPAAFNGLVGLKTENGTISNQGVTHLSTSLDTIGVLAHTVSDAFYGWQALKGMRPQHVFSSQSIEAETLLVADELLEEMDSSVAQSFSLLCQRLENKGVTILYQSVPELSEIQDIYQQYGNFAAHESAALYADLVATGELDARVSFRICQGFDRPASDYIHLQQAQKALVARFWQKYQHIDAFLAPTVPILAPKFSAIDDDANYQHYNRLSLKNTMPFNFLTGAAINIPCSTDTPFPLGVMLATAPQHYQKESQPAEIRLLSQAQSLQALTLQAVS